MFSFAMLIVAFFALTVRRLHKSAACAYELHCVALLVLWGRVSSIVLVWQWAMAYRPTRFCVASLMSMIHVPLNFRMRLKLPIRHRRDSDAYHV